MSTAGRFEKIWLPARATYQRLKGHDLCSVGANLGEMPIRNFQTGSNGRPTLVDRIQDRHGKTIYRHDQRACDGCNAEAWTGQAEPRLTDNRDQVIDPLTAYQMVSILESVVQSGTATVVNSVGKPLAGKTGTTNEAKDVWFVGFSPDLAVGVFMGYDTPRSLGASVGAGQYAAPIFRDFMAAALRDKPATPFRVPPGIKLVRVDARTGMRAGGEGGILEAFKPGTAPPDSYPAESVPPSAQAGEALTLGTGGLY